MLRSLVAMAIAVASPQADSPSAVVSKSTESQPSLELGSVASVARALRPDDFLWAPEVAPAGPMLMIVNRQTQRAVLYRNGVAIAVTTVSTAARATGLPPASSRSSRRTGFTSQVSMTMPRCLSCSGLRGTA